jgi:hypothetical protein
MRPVGPWDFIWFAYAALPLSHLLHIFRGGLFENLKKIIVIGTLDWKVRWVTNGRPHPYFVIDLNDKDPPNHALREWT